MKRQVTSALRRSVLAVAALAAAAVLAVGFASPASAYGSGANHDMWQVGLSFNCNNPSICNTPEFGKQFTHNRVGIRRVYGNA